MSWQIAIAAVGAAASVFNAVDELHSNRVIRRDIEKIKKYLIELKAGIAELKQQNAEILAHLDRLPEQIRQIVSDVVDTALLTERYSTIEDIRDNFLILNGGRGYSIKSQEWMAFSNAMGYLFDHENRLSRVFDLINICEIALAITKTRALPLIIDRVDAKIKAYDDLFGDLNLLIDSNLKKLEIDLNNTQYIQTHNLSNQLQSIEQLAWAAQPDRTINEIYTEQVCEERSRICGEPIMKCTTKKRSRQVPDIAFHNTRNAHLRTVEGQVATITMQLKNLATLGAASKTLKSYRERISANVDVQSLIETSVMYFFEDQAVDSSAVDQPDFETLAEHEVADLASYVDGWGDNSTDISPSRVKDDNRVFQRIRCL